MALTKNTSAKLAVIVTPKSGKNELVSWENKTLKIRLRALPEKGEANSTLIAFLAKELHISKSQITLTHGKTSRQKRLLITGLSQDELEQILTTKLKSNSVRIS